MDDAQRVAGLALEAAMKGAKVLVVRNTVRDCIATQVHLERLAEPARSSHLLFSCSGIAVPHHSRFTRTDRVALDLELEKRLGGNRPEGGCVVVATQTAQQSLDLDADFLVSDLCPADVLLQRLGRLHRHERLRPIPYGTPEAVVLVPPNRDLGSRISERGTTRDYHGLACRLT
jgi:CRISPR-associated endonuclease/helicase Cas3